MIEEIASDHEDRLIENIHSEQRQNFKRSKTSETYVAVTRDLHAEIKILRK